MQENNFEDKMRQKMDDLKLNPSESLWPKVAVQIQKKEKGRRILLLLFFCILLISGAGFYFWNESINNKSQSLATTIKQSNQNKSTLDADTKSTDKNIVAVLSDDNPETIANTDKLPAINSTVVTNNSAAHQSPVIKNKSSKLSSIQLNNHVADNVATKNPSLKYSTKASTKIHVGNVDVADVDNNIDENSKMENHEIIDYDPELIRLKILSGSTNEIAALDSKKIMSIDPVKQKSTTGNSNKKDNIPSKWQFGIAVSAGISSINNNLFGETEKAYDAAIPNSGTGSIPGQVDTIFQVLTMKPGIAFKAGVVVSRQLSSKISFVTGLNYVFYSAKYNAGNDFDSSSLNSSFIRLIREDHSNAFHFIELPLSIKWRLTREKALPLYLQTGVSFSRLVGSSALQFNSSTGYYKDNDLLNKTQANLSIKLLFGFGKNWLVGPDFNYHLSNVANTGFYDKKHFSYIGVQLQRNLFKK